jgi:hypothetical protein
MKIFDIIFIIFNEVFKIKKILSKYQFFANPMKNLKKLFLFLIQKEMKLY